MKKGLIFLLIADGWAGLAVGMIGPIYAVFVQQIGGDILDASWAYFVYMITSGVVMLLISRWEDRFKHKEKLVSLGYALVSIGCLSYYFVYDQTTLLITQAILGLALALLDPAFDSLYSHYVKRKEEAFDWGAWEAINYIVMAFAAAIGGYLAYFLGFKALFLIMFVISVFGTLTSLKLFSEKKYLNSG